MAEYKTLFKSQSIVLSPRNHNKLNRDRQRATRTKKREERFQSNRKMMEDTESPTSRPTNILEQEQQKPAHIKHDNQENQNPDSRKLTYMQRYIKWKAENRRKAPLKTTNPTTNATTPDDAVEVFVPPKRRSLYLVHHVKGKSSNQTIALEPPPVSDAAKPTKAAVKPTQLQPVAKAVKPALQTVQPAANVVKPAVQPAANVAKPAVQPVAKDIKPVLQTVQPAAKVAKPTVQPAAKLVKPALQTVQPTAKVAKPTVPPAAKVKPGLQAAQPTSRVAKPAVQTVQPVAKVVKPAVQTVQPLKPVLGRQPLKQPLTLAKKPLTRPAAAPAANKPTNLMTQPFDRPGNAAKIVKPLRGGGGVVGGGVVGKFKAVQATIKPHRSQAPADLATRMKVKRAANMQSKQKQLEKRPNFKQELLQIALEEPLPETPIDQLDKENPFHAQATSTHCKNNTSSSQNLLDAYRELNQLSPVTVNEVQPKSVKRQLLPAAASKENEQNEEEPKKRFNFVRYSEAHSVLESPTLLPQQTVDDHEQTVVAQTPPPSATRPNYLSPYVSVSRGKVNSQTERQKRNSMYLQDEAQPETPVAVRRTLESVHYFRMQLDSEIRRLHALCDDWLEYCAQNEERLVETGGKDMIDAAIGQTKLLTSKKLMQFASLIDRCEAGATGVGLLPNDGSEATKPVMAKDLEGWWDMMRLQSDNVDKRFNNLERWKVNDWQDPDAVAVAPPKPKAKAKPKPKVAGKASSNIRSFLRKALEEKRKAEAAAAATDQSQIEHQQDTPKKRIIVVRDRKSFSPARTVLRVSVGSSGRSSIAGNALLKSALKGAAEQKTRQQTPPLPQPAPATPKPRMSILKTPGTKKRESGLRGVIFSAKKKVRRFQFTVEEGNVSSDDDEDGTTVIGVDKLEDCEEDMSLEKSSSQSSQSAASEALAAEIATPEGALRTCVLRSRRVRMRPSSEFM